MEKRFSQACENNKQPILDVLKKHFSAVTRVLEIGSGTGQHAAFLPVNLPHLTWHTSDMPVNHFSISAWIADVPTNNLRAPLSFTIGVDPWPLQNVDAVFSANTAHIMQPQEAKLMMELVQANLVQNGVFCQYGPFKIAGQFTSESNAVFDNNLRESGYGGIRDVDELTEWAPELALTDRIEMPANNFLLVWRKGS